MTQLKSRHESNLKIKTNWGYSAKNWQKSSISWYAKQKNTVQKSADAIAIKNVTKYLFEDLK